MSKTILVTGGAGFLGTNLCLKLKSAGDDVICLDRISDTNAENLNLLEKAGVTIKILDIRETWYMQNVIGQRLDQIYHLACRASPPKYQEDPIDTMMTSVQGTYNVCNLAKKNKATVLFSSTSEVYGDPEIHPQTEEYRGSVSIVGPRACYDEGKRAAEALIWDFQRMHSLDVRVARIFNTYGPHMDLNDGRVVTNFIKQKLAGEEMTIFGDGTQTRSICYVDDMIDGLNKLMNSDYSAGPVNLGNCRELTIKEIATLVHEAVEELQGRTFQMAYKFHPLPADDPKIRQPDISKAKKILNWEPKISAEEGLRKTLAALMPPKKDTLLP